MGDWDVVERLMGPGDSPSSSANMERNVILGAAEVNPGQASVSVPGTPTEQGQTDTVTSQEGVQAFPVLKGNPYTGEPSTHHVLPWKALIDLQDNVAKYGLGSSEVMQII